MRPPDRRRPEPVRPVMVNPPAKHRGENEQDGGQTRCPTLGDGDNRRTEHGGAQSGLITLPYSNSTTRGEARIKTIKAIRNSTADHFAGPDPFAPVLR